jgi:hypothetical protein
MRVCIAASNIYGLALASPCVRTRQKSKRIVHCVFGAGLDPKILAKWYCSVFRCYLVNIVQLWSN